MNITDYIRIGKDNAITRESLSLITHLSDRAVREEIEKSRLEGFVIINDQDGKGYYLSSDLDETERQYRQNHSRAMSILKCQKRLRQILKEAGRL